MGASTLVATPLHIDDLATSGFCRRSAEFLVPVERAIQVYLSTMGGDSLVPFQVCKSESISCIELPIQENKGFFVDPQRSVYPRKGIPRNECSLQDYDLHLVLPIPNIVSLTLRTIDGRSFVYKVWQAEDPVRPCRLMNQRGSKLPLDIPIATLRGEEIGVAGIVEEFSLRGESKFILQIRKPSLRSRFVNKELELIVSTTEGVYSSTRAKTTSSSVTAQSKGSVDLKGRFQSPSKPDVEEQYLRNDLQPSPKLLLSPKYFINFELPGHLKDIVNSVSLGLNAGQVPKLTPEGSGGVYFMKDEYGSKNVAVFKPMDEEPMAVNNPRGFSKPNYGEGLRRGTRSGEGAIREVAAYVLDHPAKSTIRTKEGLAKKEATGFSGVPPTTIVRIYHEAFHYGSDTHKLRKVKSGSLQQFVDAFSSCEDMGAFMFPVDEVHKISVLDMRLANTDRNGGNILVQRGNDGQIKLVPIDHGYCLPDKFEDCSFEWLYWPQAQRPFSPSTVEYIMSLDAEQDIALLQKCGWSIRPQLARVLRISTLLLKKGAAAGLTPFEIGSIMTRGASLDMKSAIELILDRVEAMNLEEGAFLISVGKLLDEHIASLKK